MTKVQPMISSPFCSLSSAHEFSSQYYNSPQYVSLQDNFAFQSNFPSCINDTSAAEIFSSTYAVLTSEPSSNIAEEQPLPSTNNT